MFQLLFAALVCLTESTQGSSIPIHWSADRLPYLPIQVDDRTDLRILDTVGTTHRFEIFDSNSEPGREVWATLHFSDSRISIDYQAIVTNMTNATLTFPIAFSSGISNIPEVDWFTVTPRGFFLVPTIDLRRNYGELCQYPSEAVRLPAGASPNWILYLMTEEFVLIDSMSPNIGLLRNLFDTFMDQVEEVLNETGYNYTIDPITRETTIHRCNITDLDFVLPELEFAIAYPNPDIRHTSFFMHNPVPHYVRFTPGEYIYQKLSGDCNLGVVPSNAYGVHVLGSVLFQTHSVSFHGHSRQMMICRPNNPII